MNREELILLQQEVTKLRAEGKYKETIEGGHHLLFQGQEVNDYKSILIAYINIAAAYYCIGDIEQAFLNIEQYEKICHQYGDDADQLNLYNVLFLLFEYTKDYQKAKETLEKSIQLGMELEKYNIVSNGYSNYSHVCIVEENYEEARKKAKLGLDMAKLHEPNSVVLEMRVKLNLAHAYVGLGEIDTARNIITELEEEVNLDSLIREKAQLSILKGYWLSKQKLYNSAFDELTKAKEIVDSYQDLYLLKTIQEERCKLCELMNDISLGYKVQKEYISLLEDIKEREHAMIALKLEVKYSLNKLEQRANTDFLTGLANRSYLENMTDQWLGAKESLVCTVFDLDKFKEINDKYGHLFGDEVIKQVGKACTSLMEENDVFGRYGGDEFVIISKDTSIFEAEKKAEQILKILQTTDFGKDGVSLPINASIGLADNVSHKSYSFTELFHDADLALYMAKQNGKNQIRSLTRKS